MRCDSQCVSGVPDTLYVTISDSCSSCISLPEEIEITFYNERYKWSDELDCWVSPSGLEIHFDSNV